MFAKRARHGFIYLFLIVIAALAASATGSRTSAQEAAEPSLDQLFEDAFAAVAGVTDPFYRLYIAHLLSEADVNHGGRRLEARLVSILEPALEKVSADYRARSLAKAAETLAVYGRTSEMLGVMRELNSAWNYGRGVLKILAKKGDVATAVILAERESDPRLQFRALLHILNALVESGKMQEARQIFDQVQSIYGALDEYKRDSTAGEYLGAMAHFDLRQAERLALGFKEDYIRNSAILAITNTVTISDPARALEMALKIKHDKYRGYAVKNVIYATADKPDQQNIYQRALAEADPRARADAFQNAARVALANGDFARASEALDRLDAMLPGLSEKDRARVAYRPATRLAIEVLSGDVNQVFEKMEGLTYSEDFRERNAVLIIANALLQNGHYDLGRRVAETIQDTFNHAGYFIAAINARFE